MVGMECLKVHGPELTRLRGNDEGETYGELLLSRLRGNDDGEGMAGQEYSRLSVVNYLGLPGLDKDCQVR